MVLRSFEDERAFHEYLATKHRPGRVRESQHYAVPRAFGGNLLPRSDAARLYFQRFQASKDVFTLALDTGLRRGDLLGLHWTSIHLAEGWIRVSMIKTGRDAIIPISANARELLERRKNRHEELVLTTSDNTGYSGRRSSASSASPRPSPGSHDACASTT